jgi:hypothetical protein
MGGFRDHPPLLQGPLSHNQGLISATKLQRCMNSPHTSTFSIVPESPICPLPCPQQGYG